MKVVAALVAVLACCAAVGAQNVVCAKGTSSKTVTVEHGGKALIFKTQKKGKKYQPNQDCTVEYKMGSTCAKMSFACSKSNIINKDKKKCLKGDKMTVTINGKARVFCQKKKVKATSTGDMMVNFLSGKKKQRKAMGVICKVTCTEEAGSTVSASPTQPPTSSSAPSACQCGIAKRKTRIVGGMETEVNEYPWQVGIVKKVESEVFCGATLISNQWILSAAHCFLYDSIDTLEVVLGEHDYNIAEESDIIRTGIEIKVDHPSYDKYTSNYDFSLLKLDNPVDFAQHPHIRPACLPDGDDEYAGLVATVTGWGTTSAGGPSSNKLREVSVNVMTNTECRTMYDPSWITEQMLCAMVKGGGKDACQGDSGGPLVTAVGENYEVIGVVSWGDGCAGPNSPGVYSRVTAQISWIIQTTAAGWTTCPRT